MMTIRTTTTLPCPTTIQGVVGSNCNGCSLFTFFGSILFVLTMWQRERTSRPKHGAGFVGTLRQTSY